MSMNNLTAEGEFRYVIQWFNEWSELQRDDFIPILIEYLTKEAPGIYVNGVVSGLANTDFMDKPMSLFQCRIKLFKEWTPKWPEDMKQKLKEKILELDTKVGEKITEELRGDTALTEVPTESALTIPNGSVIINPLTDEVISTAVALVEETEIALNSAAIVIVSADTSENKASEAEQDEVVEQVVQELDATVSINEEVPLIVA